MNARILIPVILLVGPAIAHAQPHDEEGARELFKQGYEQLDRGEYVEALANFEAAYRHWPNPKILLNIATTLRQLGRFSEAAERYEQYLRDPGAAPERVDEVKLALQEVEPRCGRIRVIVSDPRIIVRVDGRTIDLPDSGFRVDPGEHVVLGELDGQQVALIHAAVRAGETQTVSIQRPATQEKPLPPPQVREAETLSHQGQVGIVAGAEAVGSFSGTAGVFGVSYGATDWLEPQLIGIAGRDGGIEAGATFHLLTSIIKPIAHAGFPVFIADGLRPGVHVSAGFQLDPVPSAGLFARGGVAIFASGPDGYDTTFAIWSFGAQGRF